MPLEKHAFEPPICAAARLACDGQIFELLMAHGAQPDQEDAHGRSATDILRSKIELLSTTPQVSFGWGLPFQDMNLEPERLRLLACLNLLLTA